MPGGPRVRRVADPRDDHRGRGRAARHGRHLDHVVRRAGHGPDRRGHHAHLAGRARHEGAARLARRDLPADNERARRYVAKYTINPAIAHGLDHEIGSVEPGKLADLVLWDPRFFGVRPEVVIKGGAIVWAALGDPNASIPTPQPVLMRPTLVEGRGADHSVTFVAPAAIDDGLGDRLGLRATARAVKPTRDVGKADMVNNDALPGHRRSTPRRSPSRSTASWSARRPPNSCRWRSCTRCSDVATPVHPGALMLLADARLPVAGHTQSGGLEPALAARAGPGDIPAYCVPGSRP